MRARRDRTAQAGLAEQRPEWTTRWLGTAVQQAIADDSLVEDAEFGRSAGTLLQPLGKTSGQRRFASLVEPSPSVVEDPNATIAAPRDDAATSTPVRNGHEEIVFDTGNFTAAVQSPVSDKT